MDVRCILHFDNYYTIKETCKAVTRNLLLEGANQNWEGTVYYTKTFKIFKIYIKLAKTFKVVL